MNFDSLSIVGPALLAGILVLATHVPLGREVLGRGIIFIDLAVAQIAGLGVIAANGFGLETHGVAAQVAAFASALAGGLLLSCLPRPRTTESVLLNCPCSRASLTESETALTLPLSACEDANITTKKANNRVMKSA